MQVLERHHDISNPSSGVLNQFPYSQDRRTVKSPHDSGQS